MATAAILFLGVCPAVPLFAGPAEKFTELHQQYLAVDKQLSELTRLYYDPQIPAREPIAREYGRQVEKANALLAELRTVGIAAYTAAPNADEKTTRVLLGMVNNDLKQDRFDTAHELAQLLIENKCTEKVLSDLAGQIAYARDDFAAAETLLAEAKANKVLSPKGKSILDDLPKAKERWAVESELREKEAAGDLPRVKLQTSKGDIVVELFEDQAPQTVGNFVSLVEKAFYDGKSFHRVLPGFMAQGGDPKGDGTGGPDYHIYCECEAPNHRNHFRGTLSMAHAGKDTGGSQFFLTFLRTPQLDGKHTVFGRVIEGLDVLAKLQRRDPDQRFFKLPEPDKIVKATVVRKRDHAYEPTKVPKTETEKGKPPAGEKGKDATETKDDKDKKEVEKGKEKTEGAPTKEPE